MRGFLISALSDEGKKSHYFILYSLIFLVTAFLCFLWFIFSGRSLIWNSDGWAQHFRALVYYGDYLRDIFSNLFSEGKMVIPDWDLYIGEGSDVLNTFNYYAIGDPIAFLSVFIPKTMMHHFYTFGCILRLFLSGMAFSLLCFGTKNKNRLAILAGAMAYCFCHWALIGATRHPYFLNPMIYFPLMILGIEKLIRKEKPYLFIATTALAALSNFYFFYMIALLTVVYTVIRLILIYKKEIKTIIMTIFRIGVYAVVGACIAGIILLPVVMMVLNDSRMSVEQQFFFFYPMSYYSQLPAMFISHSWSYWLCIGFSFPVIASTFLLFIKKKQDRLLKILFIIAIAIILLPIGGRLLNGMSYMTNRWTWAFSLLCVYIFMRKFQDMVSISKKEWKILAICCSGFLLICFIFEKSRSSAVFSGLALLIILILLIKPDMLSAKKGIYRGVAILVMTIIGASSIAFWKFAPGTANYSAEFPVASRVGNKWVNNEAEVISELSDSAFTRITGRELTENANTESEISSTQYFWSLSNPYVNSFRADLSLRDVLYSRYYDYDDRAALITLSATRYYSAPALDELDPLAVRTGSTEPVAKPYGFSLVKQANANPDLERGIAELRNELGVDEISGEQMEVLDDGLANNLYIYENEYALPLGFCYDSYFTKEEWNRMDAVQRQEAMLDAAMLDGEVSGIAKADIAPADFSIEYSAECKGPYVVMDEGGIVTTKKNTEIELTLPENLTGSEIYLGFEGLSFTPTPEYELYFGEEAVDPLNLFNKTNWELISENARINIIRERFFWDPVQDVDIRLEADSKIKTSVSYMQPESAFAGNRSDIIASFGYCEKGIKKIKITLPLTGIYAFDSLKVYSVPMEKYPEKVARLQRDVLEDIEFENDAVSGRISVDESRLLCLATPYSEGWKASVDGAATEVFCLNGRYLGIVVPGGEHDIMFRYEAPHKKAGALISLGGLAAFALVIAVIEIKGRKQRRADR